VTAMAWIDVFFPSRRRRSRLLRAAKTADIEELLSALPAVNRTDPNLAVDVECLLVFFEALVEYSSKYSRQIFDGLQHIVPNEPLEPNQQERLSRIYMRVIDTALEAGAQDLAVEFGLAGWQQPALGIDLRQLVLVKLVESRCVRPPLLKALRKEFEHHRTEMLMQALRKGAQCSLRNTREWALAAYQLGQIGLEVGLSEAYIYQSVTCALLRLDRPVEAIRLLEPHWEGLRSNGNLRFLLALAHFRIENYGNAAKILSVAEDLKDPRGIRLQTAIDAARHFYRTDLAKTPGSGRMSKWTEELMHKHALDELLGPGLTYVQGRLLSVGSRLANAADCFERAALKCDTVQMQYYAIHIRQLRGQWKRAGELLNKCSCPEPEILSLRLKQVRHNKGGISEEDVIRLANVKRVADTDPLILARYALCMGQPVSSKRPRSTARRTYLEESLRVELAASLGSENQEASANSLRALKTVLFASFPRPEQLFYLGAFYWLQRAPDEARKLLQRAVKQMPLHLGVLKCLASLALEQGDKGSAVDMLGTVVSVDPRDYATRLRRVKIESTVNLKRAIEFAGSMLSDPGLSERLAMQLGRLLLNVSLGEPGDTGEDHRQAAMELATRAFAAAGESPTAQWYRWLLQAMAVPFHHWKSSSQKATGDSTGGNGAAS